MNTRPGDPFANCTCLWWLATNGLSGIESRDPACPQHGNCTCLWKTQEANCPQHGRKEEG